MALWPRWLKAPDSHSGDRRFESGQRHQSNGRDMKFNSFANAKVSGELAALYTIALKGMINLNGVIVGCESKDNMVRVTISVRCANNSYKMYCVNLKPRK